jgi:hypothetical protein
MIISSTAFIISLLLSTVNPDFHAFSVLDLDLSYPYRDPKLNGTLFIFLSIIFPLLTIISIDLFIPFRADSSTQSGHSSSPHHARKLQHLNAALLGLGVSLVTSTVIATGVKNLSGKPRPTFLSTCDPSIDDIEKYAVGDFGARFDQLWVMVTVDNWQESRKGSAERRIQEFSQRDGDKWVHFLLTRQR